MTRRGPSPPFAPHAAAAARPLETALSLHRLGRLDEAARLYQLALKANPHHFDALHNLALLRLQQSRPDEAAKLLRKALEQNPAAAEAHNSLGTAWQMAGRLAEAMACYQRAIACRADYAEAHFNLGTALQAQNRPEDAATAYRAAIAARPAYAEAHGNLGIVLCSLLRHDEAVAAFERAVALKPDYAEAFNNLGGALRELGRRDAARQAIERAIALAPGRAEFYQNLALSKRFAADDPHLLALERLATASSSRPPAEQMRLHFALGQAYAEAGQHERAFAHLAKGNALMRRRVGYDEAATLGLFERLRGVFTREFMRARQGAGFPSPAAIFVVGMPRSGTTLVEQILASHPEVFGAGEVADFHDAAMHLTGAGQPPVPYPEIVPGLSATQLADFGKRYVERVSRLAPSPAARIVDKLPGNFRHAGLIHLVLPKARIIHTRRDPVDTCLSCYTHLFTGHLPYAYDLGDLGRFYRGYAALMQHWRQVLPEGVMLEIDYEELVADLEGQARRMLAHCGLAWDPACLEFHKTERPVRTASALQVRQPIYRSAVGRWRAYGALLVPLLAALGMGMG